MAIGKAATGIVLAGALWAVSAAGDAVVGGNAAQPWVGGPLATRGEPRPPAALAARSGGAMEFAVTHQHLRKGCRGVMTVDDAGVKFIGGKGHVWDWKYQDIQELTLEPSRLRILTYKDSKLRLGADRAYEFAGELPARDLYQLWQERLDQRFVAALPEEAQEGFSIPVKHAKRMGGSEGVLAFGPTAASYATAAAGESRTWRYSDIDSVRQFRALRSDRDHFREGRVLVRRPQRIPLSVEATDQRSTL